MQGIEIGTWLWNIIRAATPFTVVAIILVLTIQLWRKQMDKRTDLDAEAMKRRDENEQKQRELDDARKRLEADQVRYEADKRRDQERWMEMFKQMREIINSNQAAMDQKTMAMITQNNEHSRQLFELLTNLITTLEMQTSQISRIEQKIDSSHYCPIVRQGSGT